MTIRRPFLFVPLALMFAGCEYQPVTLSTIANDSGLQTPAATIATSRENTGWPCIYGPTHNSISSAVGVQTTWPATGPIRKWSRPIGVGYCAPISVGDKAIVFYRTDDEETIECLSANDGSVLWSFKYPTTFTCPYEYSDGPYSTPTMNENRVFAIGAEGKLHCLNLHTGDLIWKRDLFEEYTVPTREWAVAASPLLLEDRLIFNLGAVEKDAGIVAIDIENGSTLWESTNHGYSHTTPVPATIHGRQLVFVLTFEGLVCLNPENGSVYWDIPHRIRQLDRQNAISPIVYQDRVIIVTGPNVRPGLRCLRILPDGSYDEPWQNFKLLKSQYTNLVVVGGYLFGFTPMTVGGPTLKCIDIMNGKLAWQGKPDLGRGNMLAVSDSLIVLGEDGTLASLKTCTEKMVLQSRTEQPVIEKPCYTSMALNRGLLYLRNERELVCFDLNIPVQP